MDPRSKSVLERIQEPRVENHYNMTSTSQQYPPPQHGGWIPNMNDPKLRDFAAMPYSLYTEKAPIFGWDNRFDMVGHIHQKTPLNEIFFSQANVDKIQADIQAQVLLLSAGKYNIDRQNDDDVKIIMRSYYLMFALNNPNNVAAELADLNSRVVGYASAKVYSEADFYMFYRKDLEDFAPPIANPMNPNVYGTRVGELKAFFS
jgi:hypothetical protein